MSAIEQFDLPFVKAMANEILNTACRSLELKNSGQDFSPPDAFAKGVMPPWSFYKDDNEEVGDKKARNS